MPCVGIQDHFCSSLCGSVYIYHHHLKRKQPTHTIVRENGEDESRLFCYAAVGRMVDMDSSKYRCQRRQGVPDLGAIIVQYSASVNKYGDEWKLKLGSMRNWRRKPPILHDAIPYIIHA
jgi:hypothetical protein